MKYVIGNYVAKVTSALFLVSLFVVFFHEPAFSQDKVSVEVQENIDTLIKTNSCSACNLAGADLNRLNLSGADLSNTDLSGATFYLADLSGANLSGAILRGTQFGGTDLAEADLRGADMRGAILTGAYTVGSLMDGTVVEREQLDTDADVMLHEKVFVPDDNQSKEAPDSQDVKIAERRDFAPVPPVIEETRLSEGNGGQGPAQLSAEQEAPPVKSPAPVGQITLSEPLDQPEPQEMQIAAEVVKPQDQLSEPPVEDGQPIELVASSEVKVEVEQEYTELADNKKTNVELETVAPATTVTGEEQAMKQQAGPAETPPAVDTETAETTDEEAEESVGPSTIRAGEPAGEKTGGVDSAKSDMTAPASAIKTEIEPVVAAEPPVAEAASLKEESIKESEPIASQHPAPDAQEMTTTETAGAPLVDTEMPAEPKAVSPAETVPGKTAQESVDQSTSDKAPPAPIGPVAGPSAMNGAPQPDNTDAAMDDNSLEPAAGKSGVPEQEPVAEAMGEKDAENVVANRDKLLDTKICVVCNLSGVDLSGEDLDESDLERSDFSGANLEGADLSESNLKGVSFKKANLKNVDFREADLYKADFSGADLTGAKFGDTQLDEAIFTGAIGYNTEIMAE